MILMSKNLPDEPPERVRLRTLAWQLAIKYHEPKENIYRWVYNVMSIYDISDIHACLLYDKIQQANSRKAFDSIEYLCIKFSQANTGLV